ncbi:MAG: heme NO-binding domain-containing protein [Pseudomonadota bacterium]
MHGLVHKAIQSFICDTYGVQAWDAVAASADNLPLRFEAMLSYCDHLTDQVIDAAARHLAKPRATLLEDVGTYLVSHPNVTAPRRLLRFAGSTVEEFLHTLDDLPDRVRLALPELHLPPIQLTETGPGAFRVTSGILFDGYGYVLVGLLRAMSDEYGALTTIEYLGEDAGQISIGIGLHDGRFREGRDFRLGAPVA